MSQPSIHPDLTGHVAIITGAGRGIGRSIAASLAAAGASVAILARTTEQLDETAHLIRAQGGRVEAFAADVSGRYIHIQDDLDQMLVGVERIQAEDLYTLRLKQ